MRIDELLARSEGPLFSFEFFPPKTEEGERNLFETLAALRELEPAFVSVTKTGGSPQARTIELVARIRAEHGLEAAAHLTCGGVAADDLRGSLEALARAGVENMLALRGDAPSGNGAAGELAAGDGYLRHASELVELAAAEHDFCIVAACYPEVHPEAPDAETDLRRLALKTGAGAGVLITQLFFDNAAYFDFVARARAAGIAAPIIPGVMPITNFEQIKRFISMCGASIPAELLTALERRAGEPEAVVELGVAYATLQCADLLARGAPGIHFYTLNRAPATRAILAALRMARPWAVAPASTPAS